MGKKKNGYAANLETIIRAACNNDLAVVQAYDLENNPVHLLCAIHRVGEEISIVPLARMFDGNPYEEYKMDLGE